MNHESFHIFMRELGAEKHVISTSPFDLYLFAEHHLLIHFINLDTFENNQLSGNFFESLSRKSPLIHHRIIHVWEDLWITRNELIRQRIRSLIGANRKKHARQTTVVRINKTQAAQFLQQHHLQLSTSAYYKLGLVSQENLLAVATFGKARTMYDGPVYYRSYELERFATEGGIHVVGGLSKLLNHFSRLTQATHIMTYADRDWSSGNSYLKLGFSCVEEIPPVPFMVRRSDYTRFFDKQITTHREQYIQVWNAGSLKFVSAQP